MEQDYKEKAHGMKMKVHVQIAPQHGLVSSPCTRWKTLAQSFSIYSYKLKFMGGRCAWGLEGRSEEAITLKSPVPSGDRVKGNMWAQVTGYFSDFWLCPSGTGGN